MYWYDSRTTFWERSRFPRQGWIFPCYICLIPTSQSIKIKYGQQILEVYKCKNCHNCKSNINPKKIKKLFL